MKIKSIAFKNHEILGNLELNFCDSKGSPSSTIIIAGENGTGKTSILESISKYFNGNVNNNTKISNIYYLGNDSKLYHLTTTTTRYPNIGEVDSNNSIINSKQLPNESFSEHLLNTKFIYSKVNVNFATEKISSVTSSTTDSYNKNLISNNNFSFIKQLLVDIDSQDARVVVDFVDKNGSVTTAEKDNISKIIRFKNAFNFMFEDLKFDKILIKDNQHVVNFKKNGCNIDIDNLSSGEKQIVFRGCMLLQNKESLKGALVFVDEPELSMHPAWQKKIIEYYRRLFVDENGIQTSQIFFTTHSEHALKEGLINDYCVIVLKKDINNSIVSETINLNSFKTKTITHSEIQFKAFNLYSFDYHIALYGEIQNKCKSATIKGCDDYIKKHTSYNPLVHEKKSTFNNTTYETLPSYIRNNCISHPNDTYTEQELKDSIDLMLNIL